ncbi:peptide ABC transporter substrate-binding protein [Terrarubrum flagellatum]|uniref:peptide ABC transporter substrate-binding protein n=1 Tax=Terrirubrum flagellatum TaxID=2895980 RepID=UPI0031455163
MRLTTSLAAFAVAGSLIASPASAKDQLTIGVAQFPSSLHPNIDAEVIKSYTLGFAIRQITAYDKDWKNTCLICTELPTLQNGLVKIVDMPGGKKGMQVTIKLKPDLKWADGEKVTAKDLEFTWRIAGDPKTGFSNGHPWTRAVKVDVVDDSTAVLTLDKVLASYNEWDQVLPSHIEGPIYEKAKEAGDYIKQTAYARTPTTPGLYNGPYMVTGYQSGAQIVLEPNPHWPGTKPGFKRIIIKLIENTAALQANLLSGDVDMVAGEGVGLTIDQVLELRKQQPDKFTYIFKPSLNYEHIDLQNGNPLLQDIRVRQALVYSADRKTLTERLFQGMQPVADTWVNPLSSTYAKEAMHYPYDLAKAKSLLAEAGWKPGPDGICRNDKGDRLSIEFGTTAGNRLRELQQQVLQNNWKQACIEVRIKNEPARTFFGETMKKRAYSGLAMYAWSSNVGASPRRTLASDNIPTEANGWGGANYINFSNKRMDELIDRSETELDPDKQKEDWAEMQKIYAAELPVIPLFFRAEAHVVPKWLKGYEPTGHGDWSCFWSENWRSE